MWVLGVGVLCPKRPGESGAVAVVKITKVPGSYREGGSVDLCTTTSVKDTEEWSGVFA